jgi:hypothetical protein
MRLVGRLALLLVVACATAGNGAPPSTTPAPVTTGTRAPSTSNPPVSTTQVLAGCAEVDGFVDGGRVMRVDQPTSDTNTLGLISWQTVDGCERFTVRFETTEGAPATTPPTVVVDFLESRQVLRVCTDVEATVVTDQLVETSLVDRFYVVRGIDGGMFIDLHLDRPAQARAEVSNSPAQLTVELESGVQPFDSTAVFAGNTVVITPGDGTEAASNSSLVVSGYARVFEANVVILATIGGRTVAETTATAADWTETWGEFTAPIQLPPGEVSLFVGELSPADGEPIGATIELTVR